MAEFERVDARWGFEYGEDQLLYILNVGHVHPFPTVSPFHADCEYHLVSSLIPIWSLHRIP